MVIFSVLTALVGKLNYVKFNPNNSKWAINYLASIMNINISFMACSICQICYSGTSSKPFDLSQNCVLESTELVLLIPNILWNSRITEFKMDCEM